MSSHHECIADGSQSQAHRIIIGHTRKQTVNSIRLISRSESETDRIAVSLSQALDSGLTIALNGLLGAGKTRFVRALCHGLDIDVSAVNSPTFVIMQLYTDGRLPVAHMDTYRLADTEEFLAIGAEEYLLSEDWVCVVEWADRIADVLPPDRIEIRIEQTAEFTRRFDFSATGPRAENILDAFSGKLPSR